MALEPHQLGIGEVARGFGDEKANVLADDLQRSSDC